MAVGGDCQSRPQGGGSLSDLRLVTAQRPNTNHTHSDCARCSCFSRSGPCVLHSAASGLPVSSRSVRPPLEGTATNVWAHYFWLPVSLPPLSAFPTYIILPSVSLPHSV